MEDEIEAFMSVYADDALLDSLPSTPSLPHSLTPNPTTFIHNISVSVKQRGSLNSSTCFVEAMVSIYLPETYPTTAFPTVTIDRTSGLPDDGKEFKKNVDIFFKKDIEIGDNILFPLMDIMLDYLDSVKDGECLICLSSLLINPTGKIGTKKPCALRTSCYHCFHVHCLTRWGAIHISNEFLKETNKEETVEGRASRAMEGELKSLELQLEQLQSTMNIRQDQLESLSSKIKAAGGDESSQDSDVDVTGYVLMSISQLKAEEDKLITQQDFIKNRLKKETKGKPQKSFGDELRINRVHLTAVQNHLKDLRAEDSAEGDTKTLSQLRNMHQQLGIKVREDEDKKKKLESRLNQAREKLEKSNSELLLLHRAKTEAMVDASFPCPCCRTPLNDCLPQDRPFFKKKIAQALNNFVNMDATISSGSKATADSKQSVDLSNDSGSLHEISERNASVTNLTPELQVIVRRIQKSHADLRASLHAKEHNHSDCTNETDCENSVKSNSESDFTVVSSRKGNVRNRRNNVASTVNTKVVIPNTPFEPTPPALSDYAKASSSDSDGNSKCTEIEGSVRDCDNSDNKISPCDDEQDDINEAIRLSLLSITNTEDPGLIPASLYNVKPVALPSAKDIHQSLYSSQPRSMTSDRDVHGRNNTRNKKKYDAPVKQSKTGMSVIDSSNCKNREGDGSKVATLKTYTFDTSTPIVTKKKTVESKPECVCCGDIFDLQSCLYAIGSCNHASVCGMCSLRSRLIVRDFSCAICRQKLDVILCTTRPDIPFDIQMKTCVESSTPSSKKKKKNKMANESMTHTAMTVPTNMLHYAVADMWMPKQYMTEVLSSTLEYQCKVCKEVLGDLENIKCIKKHLLEEHELQLCEVCIANDNRHIFASELEAFTETGLREHMKGAQGNSTGVAGHPLCNLCDKHLYDTDAMVHHLTDDHFSCYICEAACHSMSGGAGPPPQLQVSYSRAATNRGTSNDHHNDTRMQSLLTNTFNSASTLNTSLVETMQTYYFKSKTALHDHFRKSHHCCRLCKKMREVAVFGTVAELDAHMLRSHPSSSRRTRIGGI